MKVNNCNRWLVGNTKPTKMAPCTFCVIGKQTEQPALTDSHCCVVSLLVGSFFPSWVKKEELLYVSKLTWRDSHAPLTLP
jgi:hypothetical protein